MNLKLVTLGGVKLDETVYSVTIPTIDGEISVLPSHEPLVTVAKDGVITVRWRQEDSDNQLEYFAISGGVVKIDYSSVQILVDEADHGDDIIEAETQAALERAIKARDEAGDQVEREKAKQLIDRHMVRLKVADLHRRKRRR
ncbi:ATP synthase F1 subunit epsilon [Candidatus Saccharibacteria bacterium oral taxon 488]|nr:ATP synthase F1 subunit epsilon [Candidatus Saccharibacteria bacterium oral taxon 488]